MRAFTITLSSTRREFVPAFIASEPPSQYAHGRGYPKEAPLYAQSIPPNR